MKKCNKLGAALLALCLAGSMSLTAFAQDFTSSGSGDVTITAKTTIPAGPTYTVTIPSTIPVGNISKTEAASIKSTGFALSASAVLGLGSKQINVTISTADNSFQLASGESKLPYKVYNTATGGTALTSGGRFASFTADGTVNGRIDIDQADIPAAGDYTGTLTFTIALGEKEAAG